MCKPKTKHLRVRVLTIAMVFLVPIAWRVLFNRELPAQAEPTLIVRHSDLQETLKKILVSQQQAWNAGDLGQFMKPYWKSEQLTFSSGGKVTVHTLVRGIREIMPLSMFLPFRRISGGNEGDCWSA